MFKTIRQQLGFWLFIIGIIVATATGFLKNLLAENQSETTFSEQAKAQQAYAAVALIEPVFTYDYGQITQIANAMTGIDIVAGVTVTDHRGKVLAESGITGVTDQSVQRMLSTNIVRDEEKIGEIVTIFSKASLNAKLSVDKVYGAITTLALVVTMVVVMFIAINKLVLRQLSDVTNSINEIAQGDGDLTRKLQAPKSTEFSRLARHFNTLLAKLISLIQGILDAGLSIQTNSEHVRAKMDVANTEIETQVQDVRLMSESLHDMAIASTRVHEHSKATVEQTQDANEKVKQGQIRVEESVNIIKGLDKTIGKSAEQVSTLKQNSEKIGSVMTVIKSIAEQTNLLALNAAIEAARAGEQGRGFAVVADEVRTLAQRTQSSTAEIEDIVNELQTSAEVAHESMVTSQSAVGEAAKGADGLSAVLTEINSAVASVNEMNQEIVSASAEQTAVSDTLSERIDSINQSARALANSISDVNAISKDLDVKAHEMQQMLDQFKLN